MGQEEGGREREGAGAEKRDLLVHRDGDDGVVRLVEEETALGSEVT